MNSVCKQDDERHRPDKDCNNDDGQIARTSETQRLAAIVSAPGARSALPPILTNDETAPDSGEHAQHQQHHKPNVCFAGSDDHTQKLTPRDHPRAAFVQQARMMDVSTPCGA